MRKNILILLISVIALSSCVSKKKFDQLALEKFKADENIENLEKTNKNLENKIDATIKEYNEIRYQLTYNNAQKDSSIDSLSQVMQNLQSELSTLKENMKIKSEQENGTSKARKKQINNLESKINKLLNEKNSLEKQLMNLKTESRFALDKKGNEIIIIKDKLQAKDIEIRTIQKEVKKQKGKAAWLRKVNKKNQAEIEKLSNQIKLLKKTLSN